MENPPLIFGKNITTGEITQLQTSGNVLLTTNGKLDDLTDVTVSTPSTGQVLTYDSGNWINKNTTSQQKEYFTLNLFGSYRSLSSSVFTYKQNIYQKILILSLDYWDSIPDPVNTIKGFINKTDNFTYSYTTGNISGLNSSKTYRIDVVVNLFANTLSVFDYATTWDVLLTDGSDTPSRGIASTQGGDYYSYTTSNINMTCIIRNRTTISLEIMANRDINGNPNATSPKQTISLTIQEL